ncbi:MAG: glycoside hydrolase family 57 protein [Prevotellaceae bacterium]|jgi:alpha-amylase|nr:glycoside hydrolase family 57 protein [Prevotellaceae bacterium]
MKRTICFYFQVHQPFRLKRYRFFDIGENHYYFDEFNNRSIIRKVADRCYLPMNRLLLELIEKYGKKFKVSFSITGSAIEQLQLYAPDVLKSFKTLAETGCVEFLAETSAHSLAVMKDEKEFQRQVQFHSSLISKYFGYTPSTFRLTELIYSDEIGAQVEKMGYKTMLTEGARHILGWKSPNYVYVNAINPRLKVLLRNFRLSDDISFRFSNHSWAEWPLTSEKYVAWLNAVDKKEEIVNLFMDYETFGEHQHISSGIFEFMRNLPEKVFASTNFEFLTPSEIYDKHQPVAAIHVPYAISWADEERDLSAWLGNELQDDAFDTLYSLSEKLRNISDPELINTWLKLQNSDHFYYMCTKWFSDGNVHKYFNPYPSPYDAYINYMNVVSDFIKQVNSYSQTDEKARTEKLTEYLAENGNSEYHISLLEHILSKKTLAELKESGTIKSGTKTVKAATKKELPAKTAKVTDKRKSTSKTGKKAVKPK